MSSSRLNLILSIIAAALLWGIVAVAFDFYYDLNDDVLIKDIISGVYTGSPEAHNNQMLYPVSLLISLLYRLSAGIPWFGLLEIAGFILAFVIIDKSMLGLLDKAKTWQKLLFTIFFTLLFACLYIWEIVMLQYTVLSGILCAAATALVYSHRSEGLAEKTGAYLKDLWPVFVLLFFAFNIRSEMFLLMCPFMAAAGLIRWSMEPLKEGDYKGIFDISNIRKYFSLIALIIAVILVSFGIDRLAYRDSNWQEYRRFFDARTDVYDFTGIPDYEANREFYEGEGISREAYELLLNYNFALEDDINSDMLESIAAYARSGKALSVDGGAYTRTSKTLKTSLGEYIRNIRNIEIGKTYNAESPFLDENNQFAPFNLIVFICYVALFISAFYSKKKNLWFSLLALLAFRSLAWIYVFHMGRVLPRITHPMYLIELMILIMLVVDEVNTSLESIRRDGRNGHSTSELILSFACISAIMILMSCICCMAPRWQEVSDKNRLRNEINREANDLYSSLADSDDYYYIDVYSTVDWTEKVFTSQVSKVSSQLMGGWIAKSPLDKKKQEAHASGQAYFVSANSLPELALQEALSCGGRSMYVYKLE